MSHSNAHFPLDEVLSPDDAPYPAHSVPAPGGLLSSAAAAALLAACGGGSSADAPTGQDPLSSSPLSSPAPSPSPAPPPPTRSEAARFLLQAQFHASDADIAGLQAQGYGTWLDNQMAMPLGEKAWDRLSASGYASEPPLPGLSYYAAAPADFVIWRQLFTASDTVRKRAALALSEFFVASLASNDFLWWANAYAHYWDQLNANAFGNFRNLLEDVTLNPAMGVFLNTKGNQKENAATGRLPDENYAREVMQLFSIGLVQLNLDGTPKLGTDGNPIETYTQSDVSNLARAFTGYDFDTSPGVDYTSTAWMKVGYTRLPMTLDPTKHPGRSNTSKHSSLAATFLGVTIPANTDGTVALKTALDTLFNHPNVGPFFGRQMIQRLVTSNPSPAYIASVAAAFNDNGSGVRGDLKAVWRAVLLHPKARGETGLANPGWGKLREPMHRFIQWGRTFGLASKFGTWKIGSLSSPTSLGQSPLRSPSVFNFFRPGFVPPGTALAATKTPAPEFQIVNETSVAGYLNAMQGYIHDGIYVRAPDIPDLVSNANDGFDIQCTYVEELKLVTDPEALVARLNLLLCADQLSAATVTAIANAIKTPAVTSASSAALKLNRVAAAVLLVMSASEYLVQK